MEETGGAEGGNWDGLSMEVLEMIFCHLPVKDLLSCGVVSKNWKKAARDVLKRSKECYAHLKDFHQDFEALNEVIASTCLIEMVNGLHIRNETKPKDESGSASSRQEFRCSKVKRALETKKSEGTLEEAKQKVQEVLDVPWRYLNLDMGRAGMPTLSTNDALLLREVVFATSGSLEKLVIGQAEDWEFIPCKGNEYSQLKVIQLLNEQDQCDIHTQIFSPTFAPKLEEITGAMIELEVNNPVDSFMMKRMKSIGLGSDLDIPVVESMVAYGCISGLRRLDVQHYHGGPYVEEPDFQQQEITSWNLLVFPLILRSLVTLEELDIYTFDLYLLYMTSDGLKFPNLWRLGLATHRTVKSENEILALKQLNLAKLCPNLKQLGLAKEESLAELLTEVIIPFEACDPLDQSGMPLQIAFDCSPGILSMELHDYLTFFHTVYPNIIQVRILNLSNSFAWRATSCSVIWDMNSLEFLEINIHCRSLLGTLMRGLDALLCGINFEEADLLFEGRRKKDTNLSALIVPIRPSLHNAKSLKEIKITKVSSGRGEIVKLSWVTQITENLPVRQVRNLKVTFEGSERFYNKLKRLRAFSSILCAQVLEN